MRIKWIHLSVFFLLIVISCSGKSDKVSEKTDLVLSDTVPGKITFVELGSKDCIPCKAMVPVMDQMRAELGDQVEVVFHDLWTDEGKPYIKPYNVKVMPTQVFLDKEGKEYFRHEGFFPVEELYPVLENGGVQLP